MESKTSPSLFPPAVRLIGDLTVLGNARIACSIRGQIRVWGHLEVDRLATIDGELRSGSLHIEPGAAVRAALFIGKTAAVPVRGLRRLFSFASR